MHTHTHTYTHTVSHPPAGAHYKIKRELNLSTRKEDTTEMPGKKRVKKLKKEPQQQPNL